jgi:DNA-binding MarR family transcriptional regulator
MDEFDPLAGVSVFVIAARAGTFTKAAQKLGLTKSAVGKAITRLISALLPNDAHDPPDGRWGSLSGGL